MVDGHDAEATTIVGHCVVVVSSAPCASNGHIHLTVAHGLIGESVQVVAGVEVFLPRKARSLSLPLALAVVASVGVGLVAIGGTPHGSTLIEHGLRLVPSTLVDGGCKAVVFELVEVVGVIVDVEVGKAGGEVELHGFVIGSFLSGAPCGSIPFTGDGVLQRRTNKVPEVLGQCELHPGLLVVEPLGMQQLRFRLESNAIADI